MQLFVPTTDPDPVGRRPAAGVAARGRRSIDAGFYEYNAIRAYVPLETARRHLPDQDRANQIEVKVGSLPRHRRDRGGRPQRRWDSGYLVDNLVRQNKSLLSALRWEKLLMFIVISLIVLVAALNIVSTLILMVMEKVRDIGTLIALGATSRAILVLFVLQGFIIGVVGHRDSGSSGASSRASCIDHCRLITLDPDVYFVPFVPFRVEICSRRSRSALLALDDLLCSRRSTRHGAPRAWIPVEALRSWLRDGERLARAGRLEVVPDRREEIHVLQRSRPRRCGAGRSSRIVGVRGVGKSTLLHVLGALDRPDRGEIRLGGRPLAGLAPEQLAAIRNRERRVRLPVPLPASRSSPPSRT